MKRWLRCAAALALCSSAAAQDWALCDGLRPVLAAAPERFRSLRTEEVWTSAEVNRAKLTLPGFDACYVDQINPSFWCLARPPGPGPETTKLGDTLRAKLDACFPVVARQSWDEEAEPGVRRFVSQWPLGGPRRMRLIERRRADAGPGSLSFFLY
jgi:hypothetical protein